MAGPVDLVILGAPFQVGLELRAGDAHRAQGVLIGIDTGHIGEADRPGRKATLKVERRSGGQLGAGDFLLH
jgi:hypothetical protein